VLARRPGGSLRRVASVGFAERVGLALAPRSLAKSVEKQAGSALNCSEMAAPPPRPSARNAGARGGPSAQAGGGAARGGASHASQGGGKGDKAAGTFFLGRYRVVEEIGVGGMASVHLGRMDGPGGFQKWVAIKRIHPNLVEDDQFVDMFLDEARIAAGINHANVAQVFDLGKDEGTYWIAMEYLHGEPLRELMRRCEERNQAISCDVAARLCADAAEGLHAAHELRGKNGQLLGLVHRDVTPHNLFVTYEGYTKVVDFGIAKVADRLSETRAGTLKGKLAYMSPEQVRGQDDVDRTTDIFALGVVLWELTTNQRLFRMDTDLDTLEKVQACVVPPPSTIVPGYPIELEQRRDEGARQEEAGSLSDRARVLSLAAGLPACARAR
jgi:serine/threonine protein kinase